MAFTLAAAETLSGIAGSATSITVTIEGAEIAAATPSVPTYKKLYQGQPGNTSTTLYTAPASTATIIRTIHITNPTAGAVTIKLWQAGVADANVVLPTVSLAAGAFLVYDNDGWKLYDSAAKLQTNAGVSVATDAIWDAKGDLAAGTGADTASKLTVGADDTILMADSSTGTGLKWVASASPSAVGTAAATGTADTFTRGDHVHAHEAAHVTHDTIWDAKGDIVAATGADAASKLTVGADDTILMADAAASTGLKWAAAATTSEIADVSTSEAAGTSDTYARGDHVHNIGAHGASQHTDITSKVTWWGAGMTADGATGNTRGTFPDGIRVLTLADAATQGGHINMSIPKDAVAASALNIVLYWLPNSTDATPHTVRWSVNAKALVAGTDATAAGTTTAFTGSSAARTANQMVIEASTQILASVSADDQIRLDIRRVGADAADTYVGAVDLVMFDLLYTANQ